MIKNTSGKFIFASLAMLAMGAFQYCSSSKKAATSPDATVAAKPAATTSFSKDIMPIMQAHCTPCHFPPDGKKEALNTYAAVKGHIGDVIARVKMPSTDSKFMPFRNKKPALSEAQIALLETWQKENMPE